MNRHMHCLALGALLLGASGVRSAAAQSVDALAAAGALRTTPAGALAPLPSAGGRGGASAGPAFALRYGRLDFGDGDVNTTVAASVALPVTPRVSVGLTAARFSEAGGFFGAGLTADARLVTRALATSADALTLTAGVRGEVGASWWSDGPDRQTSLGATVGLPVTLSVGRPGTVRIIPYVAPAVGYGRVSVRLGSAGATRAARGGTRPLLGGGVAVASPGGRLTVSGGAQRVMIDGGSTTIGVGVSLGY